MVMNKPALFLNYNRSIGKIYETKLWGNTTKRMSLNTMLIFDELLIPAAGHAREAGQTLTDLSSAIFTQIRSKNMSLAAFSVNDPIKFVLASLYVHLRLAQFKRDLSWIGRTEFGNFAIRGSLPTWYGLTNVEEAKAHLASLCVRFNKIIAKANTLIVPKIPLFEQWLEHRANIYKDDEGDRYSIYLYRMANYYRLDLDPNSATVGNLICEPITVDQNKYRRIYSNNNSDDILSDIENLINTYLADDDMNSFSSEAIKAGLSHFVQEPIKVNGDTVEIPNPELVFNLDDIMSLENATNIMPVLDSEITLIPGYRTKFGWDIYEDPSTSSLIIGVPPASGSNNKRSYLPVYVPADNDDRSLISSTKIQDTPIFTHAKVESVKGSYYLFRYMVSTGEGVPISESTGLKQGHVYFAGTKGADFLNGLKTKIKTLEVFNSEMLCGITSVDLENANTINSATSAEYEEFAQVVNLAYRTVLEPDTVFVDGVWVPGDVFLSNTVSGMQVAMMLQLRKLKGFKFRPYVFGVLDSDPGLYIPDFDYITFISDESVANFFYDIIWNSMELDGCTISSYSGKSYNKKQSKGEENK